MACIRGIFAFEDEESPEWKEAVKDYRGIPKFQTKEECELFVRENCTRGSNPDFPYLQHIFTMLIDKQQIEDILLRKLEEYDTRYPCQAAPTAIPASNRFAQTAVMQGIEDRLNLPFHKEMNRQSTYNSLWYLFNHMRCGIFVMIRQKKVVMFVPFVNKDYTNTWGDQIQYDCETGDRQDYYDEKRKYYRQENIIPDKSKWWANGNIICNEHCRPGTPYHQSQYWGDQFLSQLRDMLEESCRHREIPDCEFFINKRDYPHLKANLSEPYGFLFDRDDNDPSQDIEFTREKHHTYAPILSFYISKRFADIPVPCSEDWEAATGMVFPPTFKHDHCRKCQCKNDRECLTNWECFCDNQYHAIKARDLFTAENFKKFYKPWEEKVKTAFFRGGGTGGGTTIDTNQRLHLAHLSNEWKTNPKLNGEADHSVPFLDAEVTGWNLRDKKIAGSRMTFLRKEKMNFTAGKQHYIPIYDQSKYKYILYVEGHCAANRYAFLMRLGSVILKVTSKCVADEMWYFPLLQPFVDHVPVKADLSDLEEQIQWCRDNDDKCREIARRANELYEQYVSKEAVMDYIELITTQIAQRYSTPPEWFKPAVGSYDKPHLGPPQNRCIKKFNGTNPEFCRRCHERSLEVKPRDKKRARDTSTEASAQSKRNVPSCRKCRRPTSKCKC